MGSPPRTPHCTASAPGGSPASRASWTTPCRGRTGSQLLYLGSGFERAKAPRSDGWHNSCAVATPSASPATRQQPRHRVPQSPVVVENRT